jgi:hypothetical protein
MTSVCDVNILSHNEWFAIPSKQEFLKLIDGYILYMDAVEIETAYGTRSLAQCKETKDPEMLKEIEVEKAYIMRTVHYEKTGFKSNWDETPKISRLEENTIRALILQLDEARYGTQLLEFWRALATALSDQGWTDMWEKMHFRTVFQINWLLHLSRVSATKQAENSASVEKSALVQRITTANEAQQQHEAAATVEPTHSGWQRLLHWY